MVALYSGLPIDLLYVSMSFLWWQAVAGTIAVKSSNALRMNGRYIGRHMEGLWHVHNTALNSALSSSFCLLVMASPDRMLVGGY